MSDSRSPYERDLERPFGRVNAKIRDARDEIDFFGSMGSHPSEDTVALVRAVGMLIEAIEILNERVEDESDRSKSPQ
jgi:hypothetical protein